jgi:hypothetical protein
LRRRARALGSALLLAVAGAGAASSESPGPPLPPPPLRQFVLCAVRLETPLGGGLVGVGDEADRDAASELVEGVYQFERDRLTRRVEDELGPLAFSLYVPGEPSRGAERFEALLAESCVHQALQRVRESAEQHIQARARRIWDRFHAPLELAPTESETLRLELPPSELIVAGEPFTGRVVDDRLLGNEEQSRRAVEDGLLVEAAGQTVRVERDGRFVLRAPVESGSYRVEVRHREKASPPPIEGTFSVAAAGDASASPVAEPPSAPRVVLPDQPLVVRGRLRGGGAGLATRAFVGPWEVPLVAKTPVAAIFDVTRVPAGPHPLTVFEGGELIAAAPLDRVTLDAASDRSSLDRGETATFSVRVAGLPLAQPSSSAPPAAPAAASSSIAFLDYFNNTPEIGRFRDRADTFSLPILSGDLIAAPAPVRGWDQRALLARMERMVLGTAGRAGAGDSVPSADAATGAAQGTERAPAPANGIFEHEQQYRAVQVGDFHVRVGVRVPDETATFAPMVVLQLPGQQASETGGPSSPLSASGPSATPRLSNGVDERGAFADVDGQRFYFSIGYAQGAADSPQVEPGRSFETACAGLCQCQIESWDHAEEVGEQVRALDRSRPGWRRLDATVRGCVCEEARSRCYSQLSFECKARCKSYFSSPRTDRVSGWAVGAEMGECRDVGACAE